MFKLPDKFQVLRRPQHQFTFRDPVGPQSVSHPEIVRRPGVMVSLVGPVDLEITIRQLLKIRFSELAEPALKGRNSQLHADDEAVGMLKRFMVFLENNRPEIGVIINIVRDLPEAVTGGDGIS